MIDFEDISFGYTPAAPIFMHFSWKITQNSNWAILGPSGCGKSTLLYLLAGLLIPQRGSVKINGNTLTRPRPDTGLILQDYGLLPWATVEQNARLGINVRKFYGPDGTHAPLAGISHSDPHHWLEKLGIRDIAGKYPGQISGGQRQRTAIARTLTLQPDLLLMDEPFSSLDAVTREDLQHLTLQLCQENGITMVIVTHSIEEAAILGKKILFLGKLPHSKPVVIDNPDSGSDGYKQSASFQQTCQTLRQYLVGS